MKYQIGIGRAVFETRFEYELRVIRKFCNCMNLQGETGFWTKEIDDGDSTNENYIKTARAQYGDDGSVEIDDGAIVSKGYDNGAYVQAWVWVYDCDCEGDTMRRQDIAAGSAEGRKH